MRRTCPHCGHEGLINTDQWKGSWAFAECHSCHGQFAVVRTGATQLPGRLLADKPRARPRLAGWARFTTAALVGLAIAAAPAILLFKSRSKLSRISPSATLDRVVSTSSAPISAPVVPESSVTEPRKIAAIARVIAPTAVLRAGPGLQYRRVGSVIASTELELRDLRDEWLQVAPPVGIEPGLAPAHGFWIRKDLVALVSSNPASGGTR